MKKLLFLTFTLSFYSYAINTAPEIIEESEYKELTWTYKSDPESLKINSNGVSKVFFKKFLYNKNIIIDKTNVVVENECSYKYTYKKVSPINYWKSNNTASFYREIFKKNGITIGEEVGVITTKDKITNCADMFNEFLLIGDNLILIGGERLVIYSIEKNMIKENKDKAEINNCTSPEQTLEEIFEGVGKITNCYYKDLDIISAYKKYKSDYDEQYLEDNIKLNENLQKNYINDRVNVNYLWESSDKLIIKQLFEGGDTDIVIEKEKKGTKITIYGHPD
ncbi:hypothetical protein [Providencia rettgeri]|uniref:hypothetical protein n=1 Tax=Providencia rettgeri TaxID=587 RepID=UPI0034E0ABBB